MNGRSLLRLSTTLGLAALLAACPFTAPERGAVTRDGDIVSGTGTVLYYNLEGGFFAILGDDEKTYDPINLPESFKRDGLRVRFRAKLRDDMGSFHMVGPIVEILEIRRI